MNDNKMHIAYASDDYYFTYIYAAIKTLVEHNKNVIVHYLYQDVPEKHLALLREMSDIYKVEIDLIEFVIPDSFDVLPAYGKASKTTYAKFIFPSIFPELDRILYLDPDTIVLNKIDELYNLDFDDNLIAGVIENLPWYHREASQMKEDESYINGGMVLCNLAKWREIDLEGRSIKQLQDTSMNLNYDQGVLNELCAGKILVVPPKYNALAEVFTFRNAKKLMARYQFKKYYSQAEIDEAVNKPVIVHFTIFFYGKPMSRKCTHPYTRFFQEIVKDSPLIDTLTDEDVSHKVKLRKFIFEHMPFSLYLIFERILDVRRIKIMYKRK